MKRASHFLFLLAYFMGISSFGFTAQPIPSIPKEKEPSGFMDIKFGASKEEALDFFIKKYNMTKNPSYKSDYIGDNDFELSVSRNLLSAPKFCVADSCYRLYLYFGKINKFSSYEITSKPVSASHFDTTVKNSADILSQLFTEKFGLPSEKFNPQFIDVRQGYVSFFRKWKSPRHEIFTGFSVYDSLYTARAVVTHKGIEMEEEKMLETEKNEQLKKASQEF